MKTNECLPGWSKYENYCYLIHGKGYERSWYTARNYCGFFYEAELASILNSKEQQFVEGIITQSQKNDNIEIFLGYTDKDSQKTYKWSDGSTSAYDNWGALEPNHLPGEDCAVMKADGKWNDVNCMAKHSYVCKKHIGKIRALQTKTN